MKYTGYENYDTKNEIAYYGEIKIKVEAVKEIKMLNLNAEYDDEEIRIDFVEELEGLVGRKSGIEFDNLKSVKFKLPKTGTLKIKLKDTGKAVNVKENESYELDETEYIRYVFEDDGIFDIEYTVYEGKSTGYKSYGGTIRVTVE
ncbi:MAG TPA: hypothetical protein DEF04_06710 [Clostridiales bacterium]|nr:hypothetical protein [Clostridiales bacterium]